MLWGSDFSSLLEIWSVNKNVCSYQWHIVCDWSKQLERFSYDLEMITREQKRNNKRTEIERFLLVYRTDTNAGWKKFIPENFLEINRYFTLTSYCNTIGQSNNAFSILGFSWRENEESVFWSFHSLADKTNNEHLPKPFFKVIRKSLSGTVKRATKTCILFFDIVENE